MKKLTFLLVLIFPAFFCFAAPSKIVVWNSLIDSGIIIDTLTKALDITKKEYGDYQLIFSEKMVQNRALIELKNAQLDVGYFISTAEREKQAIVIRIPIMQGLLGYRICLIKEGTQEKFIGISNKQQWLEKNISIGQHSTWPDTQVLKSNGFNVKTTFKRELLYQQLAKNRFDCFARGANEINEDLLKHDSLGLVIEKNIVLHYPFPLFFYVSPEKPLLAQRLQLGLRRLQEKGVAGQLFEQHFGKILEKLAIKKRLLIDLENSTLSQKTLEALKESAITF